MWRFEPAGLVFDEPATVTLRLEPDENEDGIKAYFLDVIGEYGGPEGLEDVKTLIRADGTVELSGQLTT